MNRCRTLPVALAALLLLASCEQAPAPGADGSVVDAESPRDLAVVVERLMPRLERLSGLERLETLRVRRQSREAARAYVEQRLAEEMPPEDLDAIRRTYVALDLIPDTLNLEALLLDLYTEQVIGYYDPSQRTLFVVEGGAAEDLQPVLAHELVHALQDQHADLDSLIARERGNDRQTAAHAALEGHAMLAMFAVMTELATRSTVDPAALPSPGAELAGGLDLAGDDFPVFARAPLIVRETLLFPYVRGVDFVHQLWSSLRPRARYPAPLDTLLPQSTAQVIDPQRRFLRTRIDPVEVEPGPPPPGWSVLRENDLGQLETAIFLAHHLGDAARAAADGWAGDRYVLLSSGGRDVLHWESAWLDDAAADAFAAAVQRAAASRPGRSVHVARRPVAGRPGVRVVDAPAGTDAAGLLPEGS